MKVSTLMAFFALLNFSSFGQKSTDSTQYYQSELRRLKQAYEDSFQNNPRTIEITRKLVDARGANDDYFGLWLFGQAGSADYDVLNADNAVDGFGPISGAMTGLGIGFGFKKNRWVVDLGVLRGFNKKTTKGNETIKTSVSTISLDIGYDLVKKRSISLFPYAGLGIRSNYLEYKAPAQVNSTANSIASLIQNNRSVKDRESELGYQAGIGFEYLIPTSDRVGIPVYIKLGTNRAFKKEPFNMEGHPYHANLQYGNWTVTAGIKFIGR